MPLLNKPKRVDKVSPLRELWDELHDKRAGVIVSLIISIILGLITSGFICIFINRAGYQFLPKRFINYNFSFRNIVGLGIVKTWYLTIPLILFYLFMCFKVYRSLRKTYNKNYDDNYLQSQKESFGGAHWQTDEELAEHFEISEDIVDTVGDVFGTDNSGKIYSLKDIPGMAINKLLVGAPGSGKSAAIILTSLFQGIRRGVSMIVTDTKGDIYRFTSAIARKSGYKVRVLNLKPNELANSDGFDLFKSLSPDDPSLDVKADVITNTIFKNTTGDKEIEDYWYKNEYNLIKMAIMVIVTSPNYKRDNKNHLPELYNFLATHNPEQLKTMMENYKITAPDIYKAYCIFAGAEARNQGSIINGAAMRLQKLGNKVLQSSLSVNEIDTVAPMQEKCIYYVIIPDQDNTYRFISALFFSQIFIDQCDYFDNLPTAEKAKSLPVLYLLDEYYNCGGIVGLPQKISTVRSRKIQLTIILQNISQLNAMYEDPEVETIKNCCTIKGLLSTNDLVTAKEFSELLGAQTIITEAHRYYEGAADVVHALPTIQKTTGENTRPLMLPEELMNGKLARDEVIYVISGMPPVRLKKYFSEIQGKPNHFLYELALQLMEEEGERIASRHKPKWRHDLEEHEAQQVKDFQARNNASNNENSDSGEQAENPKQDTAPRPPKNAASLADIFAGFDEV